MKRDALAVALVIALALPAWADVQAGVDAYSRGDYATALQELEPLAEKGHAMAQFTLGLMYFKGQGVPQDYVRAHMWFNLAASRLTGPTRDKAAKNRDSVAAKMTPALVGEAQRLAREWKPKR